MTLPDFRLDLHYGPEISLPWISLSGPGLWLCFFFFFPFFLLENLWDLLHCRQILYQLSYEGSPRVSQVHIILKRKKKEHCGIWLLKTFTCIFFSCDESFEDLCSWQLPNIYYNVVSCSIVSDSFRPFGLEPTRLLCPWDSSGKNTGVGCHFLLQEIFPTRESNPVLQPRSPALRTGAGRCFNL